MYTITLANGTKLKNLELNGNNYISATTIADSIFEGNLDTITVSDGETTETLTDVRLMSNREVDGGSWFVLGEKTAQQKLAERLASMCESNDENITDVQVALAEVYELISGGM